MKQLFKRYVVILDRFAHNTDGNPIARHTVIGTNSDVEHGTELFQTGRRANIGYSHLRNDYAGMALFKAGVLGGMVNYKPTKVGDRSSEIQLTYTPVNASQLHTCGRTFDTLKYANAMAALDATIQDDRWRIIGINPLTGEHHIALITDIEQKD